MLNVVSSQQAALGALSGPGIFFGFYLKPLKKKHIFLPYHFRFKNNYCPCQFIHQELRGMHFSQSKSYCTFKQYPSGVQCQQG